MANKSYQNALNKTESSSQSLSSSYRDMVDLSNSIVNSHQASDAISQGFSAENSNAIHQSANFVKSFADQNNITQDKAASLLAEASVGGGLGFAKGSLGANTSVSTRDQELLQKAQNVVESEDFQAAQRAATQAAKNYSHSLSDEESRRLAGSVSGSYERGMQQRAEAARSYNQAESYSQQALFTKANSASINSNYNQQFVEWLSDQRADGTHGKIGKHGTAHIIANDPAMASVYATRFMEEKHILPSSSVPASAQSVVSSYNQETGHSQYAVTKDSLELVRNQGQSEITVSRLDRQQLFEGSVDQQMSRQRKTIQEGENSIHSQREEVINKYNNEEGKSVSIKTMEKGLDEVISMPGDVADWIKAK
ncbi:hypothetical protein [Candidatus Odyssella acanthamoebae]|uniref:TraG N-terminal Proteobacteria domain-containing protein n=1 Tax=Candidatus Odyssella acanthamoebae TaxID=91604 RepID=A0A077AVH3_9PROT|nr:hypothetical protein [Candidatus Paracaedibacter acanthamoebae]AIK95653.1 hypothetical protein ID47_01210 [Candidatus Paracaedibacter acanthamoebae]